VSHVGRPRTDRLALLERAVEHLRTNPNLGPDGLQLALRARRRDVRRIYLALERMQGIQLPDRLPGRPKNRVPNPSSRSDEASP